MRSGILILILWFVVLATGPVATAQDRKTSPTPTPMIVIETWQLPFIYYEGEKSDVLVVEYEWLDVSQIDHLHINIVDSNTSLAWVSLDQVKAAQRISIPVMGLPAGKYMLITGGEGTHGQPLMISAVEFEHSPRAPQIP